MFYKNFTLMVIVMVMLSWEALYAQQRFYHKPVTLEARATQIDYNTQVNQDQIPIVDELGNPVLLKTYENETLDEAKLNGLVDMWRIRAKYWGKPEAIDYLYRLTNRTI